MESAVVEYRMKWYSRFPGQFFSRFFNFFIAASPIVIVEKSFWGAIRTETRFLIEKNCHVKLILEAQLNGKSVLKVHMI